jgi:hypothetical protein
MKVRNLNIKQKIKVFNQLYSELAGHGINGDTELAHVNKHEAAVLKAMGGSGTLNSVTGLRQYDFFGGDDPPPPQQSSGSTTVRQVSDLPEYFKPYAEKLLATTEAVYDKPYVAYEGARLADIDPAQIAALSGIEDMFTVDTGETDAEGNPIRKFQLPGAKDIQEAKDLSAKASAQFSDMAPEDFQDKYMSPYQRAVTDIQKREFEKKARQREQQRASMAAKAGAMGGSRDVLERMLGDEATQRGLSDIEATGLQAAYDKGLQAFRDDQTAARAGAGQLASLAQQEQAQGLTGLGTLQTAGEARRALKQQPLDIAYEEFGRQQMAPKQALQEMSGILRGVPVTPSTYQTTQQYQAAPTLGQQLLTAGSVAGGISAGLGKNFFGGGKKEGGIIGFNKGAYIPKDLSKLGGLAGQAARQRQRNEGYDPKGNPLPTGKELLDQRKEAIKDKYPSVEEQKENWERTQKQLPPPGSETSVAEIIIRNQVEDMVGEIEKADAKKAESLFIEDDLGPDEFDISMEDAAKLPTTEEVTNKEESSGFGFGFDFEAALPYFVMAAKAQEGGGPKATTDALIAFGKMKGDQESAKYKKSMAEYQKALAEYTKEKATIDYAKLSSKQLNQEFEREAEIAKILTEQLDDLNIRGPEREIIQAELLRSKARMNKIQGLITGKPRSTDTAKRATK